MDNILANVYQDLAKKRAAKPKKRLPEPSILCRKRKTTITNISDICESINRPVEEVAEFIKQETGVSVANSDNGLTIGVRLSADSVTNVLRLYVRGSVSCDQCKSLDTEKQKGKGTRVLCNVCNSLSVKGM